MHQEQPGQNGGSPSMVRSAVAGTELDRLRATCRRQAHVIDALSKVVATLRTGAAALKAENTDLRATQIRAGSHARAGGGNDPGEMLDVALPLDMRAPGAARIVVAAFLRGHVPAPVLDDAQLVASELVSNSVRHSGADATSAVLVRVGLTSAMVRLDVADAGRGGVIAPRPPDLRAGGGMGLNLVQKLSERWGLERSAASGTRVWAQLPCAALTESASQTLSGPAGTAPAHENGRQSSGHHATRSRRRSAGGTA
jgi:anti-sigma regulatory factor (Ser/Thr protein kinase)